ncbi:MAG: methyl-accepting chemotaxis protein [Pseudomonadota bacterium]
MKDHTSPDCSAPDSFVARRDAIDRVATMRARSIRIALFARMILYPPNGTPHQTDVENDLITVLVEQVRILRGVTRTLSGGDGTSEGDWIHRIAAPLRDELAIIEQLVTISEKIEASLNGDRAQLPHLLAEHFRIGRGGFFEAVTRVCNALWSDIDDSRAAALAASETDAKAIAATLQRMAKIGKHVRLVALNASVEAARAGDSGKGLAVIAMEFKTLAEEIQRLAAAAEVHNQA